MHKYQWSTVGELIEFQRGFDLPKSQFCFGKVPVISSNGILGYHNIAKVKAPGITIGRSGTVGFPHLIKTDFFPHNTSLFIKDFKGNDVVYIYYLLKTLDLNDFKSGSGVPTLNRNHIHLRKVYCTKDVALQQRIAAVLSLLDDKIELNSKISSEFESMAKLLFDYWFIQFDFPNDVYAPYKSAGGKMLYNELLGREIPIGWEHKKLKDVADIVMGQSPDGDSYNDSGDGTIFYQGSTDFGWRFPAVRQYTTQPTRRAIIGDILLSVRAPVGTYNIAKENCCIGRGVAALRSKMGCQSFLLYQMASFKKRFDYLNSLGTTFGSIAKDELHDLLLAYPSKDLLDAFEKKVSIFDRQIFALAQQNEELISLRDWLLPMLINGQISIGDAYGQAANAINVAAEPAINHVGSNAKNNTAKRQDTFNKIQIIYSTVWANKKLNVKQGEMATAKDIYLLDRLYGVQTNFTFGQHNWGSFDPQEKKLFNTTQYFHKPNFPNSQAIYLDLKDEGKLLESIPTELKMQISNGIAEMNKKIFHKYTGSKKGEKKELFATVLKCIEDTGSANLQKIRIEMKNWKIKQNNINSTKADKFSERETQEVLDIIINEGWHKKVLV